MYEAATLLSGPKKLKIALVLTYFIHITHFCASLLCASCKVQLVTLQSDVLYYYPCLIEKPSSCSMPSASGPPLETAHLHSCLPVDILKLLIHFGTIVRFVQRPTTGICNAKNVANCTALYTCLPCMTTCNWNPLGHGPWHVACNCFLSAIWGVDPESSMRDYQEDLEDLVSGSLRRQHHRWPPYDDEERMRHVCVTQNH